MQNEPRDYPRDILTRCRMLAIYSILSDHKPHTRNDIVCALEIQYGMTAERKALLRDLQALREFFPVYRVDSRNYLLHDDTPQQIAHLKLQIKDLEERIEKYSCALHNKTQELEKARADRIKAVLRISRLEQQIGEIRSIANRINEKSEVLKA